jgi:hypothetical protein
MDPDQPRKDIRFFKDGWHIGSCLHMFRKMALHKASLSPALVEWIWIVGSLHFDFLLE